MPILYQLSTYMSRGDISEGADSWYQNGMRAHRIVLRLLVLPALAVTGGFTWTVGQGGLAQTNRNLCELWRSLPVFPQYEGCEFQNVLVYIWFAVAVLAGVGIVVEFVMWQPFRRRVAMLAPISIIIIGFVIVLIGLGTIGFGVWRSSDRDVPAARSQVALATAPLPPMVAPPPTPLELSKAYVAAEKVELGNLIAGIETSLYQEGLPAATPDWLRLVQTDRNNAQLDELLTQIDAARKLTGVMASKIWNDAFANNVKFAADLENVIGPVNPNMPLTEYQRALNSYRDNVAYYKSRSLVMDPVERKFISEDIFSRQSQQDVRPAAAKFQAWVEERIRRIDAFRPLLR